ncbi:MAG: response regulator [Candidatus Didemnitutus sp.]|nr:response regulator [Candidatus Didemnitutus sp.]
MARILVIDDDESVRTIVRLLLSRYGHTVIEACDGQEGLELFPDTAADLVITDMMMPRKCGHEVIRALREKQPPVQIIAISGGGRPGEKHPLDTARLLGAVRVLAKPFTREMLLATINEVLPDRTAVAVAG